MKTAEEFWARVDKSGDCWEWQGTTNSTGYGSVRWHGVKVSAHRLAAFLCGLVEIIKAPTDRKGTGFVLHRCDNRRCCNPGHFFVGTQTENMLDMYGKGRKRAKRGDKHAGARLSNGQAAYVRALYATGNWTQYELADLTGTCQRTIYLVVRGKRYV